MSNFVVFDLEWNSDFQHNRLDYCGQRQKFAGEIIQIGAVRLDNGEKFSLVTRPRIFRILSDEISKLTGLTQKQIDDAIDIRDALQKFLQWCGKDCVLLQWTDVDVAVLKENLYFNGLDESFPKNSYDLQAMFRQQFAPEKLHSSLAEAVAFFKIPQILSYHDALADAVYTAKVAEKLDLQKGIAIADCYKKELDDYAKSYGDVFDLRHFSGCLFRETWKFSPSLNKIYCPICGSLLQNSSHWHKASDGKGWYSLCECPNCKQTENRASKGVFVRWRSVYSGGLWNFVRFTQFSNYNSRKEWKRRSQALNKKNFTKIPKKDLDCVRVYQPFKR